MSKKRYFFGNFRYENWRASAPCRPALLL